MLGSHVLKAGTKVSNINTKKFAKKNGGISRISAAGFRFTAEETTKIRLPTGGADGSPDVVRVSRSFPVVQVGRHGHIPVGGEFPSNLFEVLHEPRRRVYDDDPGVRPCSQRPGEVPGDPVAAVALE